MNVAILLAAGNGTRINSKTPKQFIKVLDKPVLSYTIENFNNCDEIDAICLVIQHQWRAYTKTLLNKCASNKVRWILEGGEDFNGSVLNAINGLKNELKDDDIAVISFGVSPLTTHESIKDSIQKAKLYGNGIASDDMRLSLCIKADEQKSKEYINRENIKAFSNPWSFKFGPLLQNYNLAQKTNLLNKIEPRTTSLYLALGQKIYFSKSSVFNLKITYEEDLDIFEGLLLLKQKRQKNAKL